MAHLFVNIDVPDVELGVRFYTEGLGLQVGRRLDETWVELVGAEVPIYLLGSVAGTLPFDGAEARRSYRRHWTPLHLDFVVDELEKAVERAVAAGATTEDEITDHEWGRMALLADPFGHGFCLLELTGRGYDEVASG